jgi:hypothetical protein
MTSSDTSKSFLSENVNSKESGQLDNTGFKTRQRPEAIRNSNIVAAKGNQDEKNLFDRRLIIEYFSGSRCRTDKFRTTWNG